jgi:uncharacterized membrane protein YebE (DUF533 family)
MRFGPILGSLLGAFGGRALGSALGGNAGGMVGSLLGSMLGSNGAARLGGGGGLGGLLGGNQQQGQQHQGQQHQGQANAQPSRLASGNSSQGAIPADLDDEHADVLIKAMCNAAKSDGTVDEKELQAIMGRLGEIGPEESAYLRQQLSGPVDMSGLLAGVPQGFEQEVYAVSLLAIDSVSGAEADYLKQLASGLGLSAEATARIKASVGV